MREVRAAEDGEHGQGDTNDARPIACGKTDNVVVLKGHVLNSSKSEQGELGISVPAGTNGYGNSF